jgi:hypothetical protein
VDVVAWHPNSHYIASGSGDRTVRLWDVGAAAAARLLAAQGSPITSLAFSPDGRTLAAGGEDGSIALYDLGQAKRLALLTGHSGPVWSLGFSKGAGGLLASGGADATLRLWAMAPSDASLAGLLALTTAGASGGGEEAGGGGEAVGEAATGAGVAAAAGGAGAGVGRMGRAAAAAAAGVELYSQVAVYPTRATPVVGLAWSRTNLLLAGGPLSLSRTAPAAGGHQQHHHHS